VSEFIELRGVSGGPVWVCADKIAVIRPEDVRYYDPRFYNNVGIAKGSILQLQGDPEAFLVCDSPSEVLAKIAEATSASQS